MLWVVAKAYSLWVHVFGPDEYSDTFYYFRQAEAAWFSDGLASMTREYPTPAAALLYLPYAAGVHELWGYRLCFLLLLLLADAVFLAALLRYTHPVAPLAWIVVETLAGRLALLRFDPLVAVVVGLAVLALYRRRAALAAGFVALATGLKAWPILLAPLPLGRRPRLRPLVAFVATGAALAGASLLAGGWSRLLSPLSYQSARGLQIEAIAATVPMALRLTEPDLAVDFTEFSAFEISGPAIPFWLTVSSIATVLGLLALVVLVVRWWRGGADPEAAVYLALTATGVFITTSKALSPQYLLWLSAPVVVLLGLTWADAAGVRPTPGASSTPPASVDASPAGRPHGATVVGASELGERAVRATASCVWMAALTGLTTLIYPIYYDALVAGGAALPVALLVVRNIGLAVFVLWCAWWSWVLAGRAARPLAASGAGR